MKYELDILFQFGDIHTVAVIFRLRIITYVSHCFQCVASSAIFLLLFITVGGEIKGEVEK